MKATLPDSDSPAEPQTKASVAAETLIYPDAPQRGHKNKGGRPKKMKPAKDGAFAAVMLNFEEGVAFLEDVAFAVPYAEYAHDLKLQEFKVLLYVAMSDTFESILDEVRASTIGSSITQLETIRQLAVYKQVCERLKTVARELLSTPEQTLSEKAKARAKTVLGRTLQSPYAKGSALEVAKQVMDRAEPKPRRDKDPEVKLIIFRPEDAKLLQAAMEEAKRISEKSQEREVKVILPGN